ncbi:SpoIIE family protein phosphatase [Nocardioides sp. MAHUQ-72]|uniref:SpoIIE family protein phosphatase n=1 Tax=unclassified Nocardioides TaxID=2615069 RepID=UPI00361C7AD1
MRDTFLGGGEVGRDMLAVDWAATPLGPPETWPSSLQTAVRIVLSSRFPMWMAWGPELTFFCNDAYRRDTLGAKYPWALGKPASTVWSEVWQDVSGRIEDVISTGVATWDERLLLFLERSGYTEETYHTFSYSPLSSDDGTVAGMLCVVSEDTEEVVAQRRMQTLRDLGLRTAGSTSVEETVARACAELEHSSLDLPFTLVYVYDDEQTGRLLGSTGFATDHPAAPPVHDPAHPVWDVPTTPTVAAVDLAEVSPPLPSGGWQRPPARAAVVPIAQGSNPAYGFLVAGLNPFRPLDDGYADFLGLVAGQLASAVTDARAFELEQRRAESLAALDQAKTDFFTNVSHEFRTPLTLLLGPAEDALADTEAPLPATQRQRVEVIHRNGQRLLTMVNTLLDFSRLDSGRVEASFEPVDLARYTRELASMFETAATRLGLSFTVDCPELPEPVYVDRDLWGKVVLNLLSNALKFTYAGGITVALHVDGEMVVLSVADTGAGIPLDDQAHLFERFARVRGARSRTHEGSGIGLALVAEVAQLHGGDVDVTSRPGEGSTFRFRVPLGSAHLSPERITAPTSTTVTQQVIDGFLVETSQILGPVVTGPAPLPATPLDARPRVLVVDDNADIRTYVSSLLAQEYDVGIAVDGQDGLEQALADPPDLVLTDVMMPRLDGFGLLTALRADPATVDIPVVMLSARAGEEGTLEGLEAGADDYLVKPFTARELMARVHANLELDRARRSREQLERSRALLDQTQRLARVGSWELDLQKGSLRTSEEYRRLVGLSAAEITELGFRGVVEAVVHPDDLARVVGTLVSATPGEDIRYETRIVRPDGEEVLVAVHAEVVDSDESGQATLLRGSLQDITERRAAEEALARAAADAEAAAREHAIADALQRSLLPQQSFDLEHLEVATYYRAGVEGTQVGGDWYDVIELGGGRTALVVGDVMGRGVQAAAVMGQLRSAVRAYARLDLPPADLLEFLDGIVRDLGADQIVTCLYAVFDPVDRSLRFANAGHLPPIVVDPVEGATVLPSTDDPPLGVGLYNLHQSDVTLAPGATVVLYTDGLVERRGDDLESGIESLRSLTTGLAGPLSDAPEALVRERLPEGPDDDVAVLVARVDTAATRPGLRLSFRDRAIDISHARRAVARQLRRAGVPEHVVDDAMLVTSELLTNAALHAVPPVELRVSGDDAEIRIEVHDRASYEPRKQRPGVQDEHGRGLQIVAALADRWGSRPTEVGKTVWCVLSLLS